MKGAGLSMFAELANKRVWTSSMCAGGKYSLFRIIRKEGSIATRTLKRRTFTQLAAGTLASRVKNNPSQYCQSCPENNDGSSGVESVFDCKPKKGYTIKYTPTVGSSTSFHGRTQVCPRDENLPQGLLPRILDQVVQRSRIQECRKGKA